MYKQLLIVVKGKVQGVFFRAAAKQTAESLNLKGWVKNNPDGSVSMLVEGDEKDIEKFLEWSKQCPPGARVSKIKTGTPDIGSHLDSFEIKF